MGNRIFGKVSRALSGLALIVGLAGNSLKEARADTNVVVNMTNDYELAWNWATQHTFNASSADAGKGSVISTNDWYDAGTPVSATAVPNQFYHFVNWTGDTNSVQNPITFSLTKAYSIVGNFAQNETTNKVPHWWLASYGLATNDSSETGNPDSDDYNNLEEYIADTNPTNGLSYPPALSLNSGSSMDVTIDPTSSNRNYDFESRTNLIDGLSWKFETNMPGNGAGITFEDPDNTPTKFYRYKVKLP